MSAVEQLYQDIELLDRPLEFLVPGDPTPWARTGGGSSVARFTPAKQRTYMKSVGLFANAAMKGRAPLAGPLWLSVTAVYPFPRSWPAAKRASTIVWKTSRPDVDNLAKLVGDALNGICWADDAVIAQLHAAKLYGDLALLKVKVGRLGQ